MSKRCSGGRDEPSIKKEIVYYEASMDLEKAKEEIARLQKLFEGACREARKAQLRAEEAESRLDAKPLGIVSLQKKNEELSEKNAELLNEIDRLKKEAAIREADAAAAAAASQLLSDRLMNEVAPKAAAAAAATAAARSENEQLKRAAETNAAAAKAQTDRLNARIKNLENRIKDLKDGRGPQTAHLQRQLDMREKHVSKLESSISLAKKQIDEADAKCEELEDKLEIMEKENISLTRTVDFQTKLISGHEKSQSQLKEQLRTLQERVTQLSIEYSVETGCDATKFAPQLELEEALQKLENLTLETAGIKELLMKAMENKHTKTVKVENVEMTSPMISEHLDLREKSCDKGEDGVGDVTRARGGGGEVGPSVSSPIQVMNGDVAEDRMATVVGADGSTVACNDISITIDDDDEDMFV